LGGGEWYGRKILFGDEGKAANQFIEIFGAGKV